MIAIIFALSCHNAEAKKDQDCDARYAGWVEIEHHPLFGQRCFVYKGKGISCWPDDDRFYNGCWQRLR